MEVLNIKKGFNGTQLKLIALALMLLDHIYEFFSFTGNIPIWFTWLGRLSAPLFLFTLIEGYKHTSNVKKYMLRLYVGFVVMGCLDLIVPMVLPRADGMIIENNIFGTLFMIAYYMLCIDKLKASKLNHDKSLKYKSLFMMLAPLIASALMILLMYTSTIFRVLPRAIIPTPIFCEGGIVFVILGIVMFLYSDNLKREVIAYSIFSLIFLFGAGELSIQNLLFDNFQWMMIFSGLIMLTYNYQRGKGYKYLFYTFYPAHIILLYILSAVL